MRKISHWLESYTAGESLDLLADLASVAANKGGAVGHEIAGIIRKGDFARLVAFELDYAVLSIEEARYCRQALALFQKLEFLDIGVDKKTAALDTFERAETLCRETNDLFKRWAAGEIQFIPAVERIFHRAQFKIARILGDVPKPSELRYRFGPGATSLTKKRDASIKRKLDDGISCSEELAPYAGRLLEELPELVRAHSLAVIGEEGEERDIVPIVIHDGKVTFVLKNAKTFRAVETQPVLNGLIQQALGDYMSDRLRRFGLDLSDQMRNREAARLGSIHGALATLDLKSASDTVAIEPVAHFLPVDWFNLLFAVRTGTTRVAGKRTALEKMSAQGNGYTFPLESLIFWTLATSCVDEVCPGKGHEVSVFGDDIIIPVEAVPLMRLVLHAAGFWLNETKSYWEGPFRESCGADFLSGIDIRPVYQKTLVTPASLFTLHNGFVRRGMTELANWVLSRIHPALVLFGPDGYGDGHLLSESWKGRSKHRSRGYEGLIFDTFTRISKRDKTLTIRGDRLLPLYSVYMRGVSPLCECESVDRFFRSTLRSQQRRANGVTGRLEEPSLPIPFLLAEGERDGGMRVKSPTYPGFEGYKKISIYTLGVKPVS